MDNQTFAQDGDEYPDDPAALYDDAEESPSDDEVPEDTDQTDESDDTEAEEEDPAQALAEIRRQMAERDERDRQRAEVETQREAERQQAEQRAQEEKRATDRRTAKQVYQGQKAQLNARREQDAITAAKADDPALMARHLAAIRSSEEATIEGRYEQWVETDRQLELADIRAQRDRAALGQYADYVRNEYGLPHDELQNIMKYRDGTPVAPEAMPARAFEIVEQRKERANHKRQLTRQQREEGRSDLRGRTRAVPGRGRGNPPQEFEGTIEELQRYFPRRRDLQRRSG